MRHGWAKNTGTTRSPSLLTPIVAKVEGLCVCAFFPLCFVQKPCRRLALISCKSCSLVLGEAVAPGKNRSVDYNDSPRLSFAYECFFLLCLAETLKLYITQVVVEPAVGDRQPEASLNRQVFIQTASGDDSPFKARSFLGNR